MKIFTLFVSVCALGMAAVTAHAADPLEEVKLIRQLQSDAPLAEKAAACARLKNVGSAACVPALSSLLTDDQLAHSARYALESMPAPEAGKALLDALNRAKGSNQVGIINSLAMRGEAGAVQEFAKLLSSGDQDVAVAAAEGLGRIGGAEAAAGLESALAGSRGETHRIEVDALLACAERCREKGELREASRLYRRIYAGPESDDFKLAAYRGLVVASGPAGLELVKSALAGNDPKNQAAALEVAVDFKGAEATKVLSDLLPGAQPPLQIALLQCLGQRGDPGAVEPVARLLESPDKDVRLAAIAALGDLGNGSVAMPLAKIAASSSSAEKEAARQSLRDLRRGEVTPQMLEGLSSAAPQVQTEIIAALGERGDLHAVPKLLEFAQSPNDSLRGASFQALATLAGPAQIADFVQLASRAKSEEARSQAADTLVSICQRNQRKVKAGDIESLVQSLRTGPVELRVALLPACAAVSSPSTRQTLRESVKAREPQVHDAAIRALCETSDAELWPDLVQTACHADEKKWRVLAVRGCARFAQEEGAKLSTAQKLDGFKTILDTSLDDQEKRAILSALASIGDEFSLALAVRLMDEPAVRPEAAQAVIQISNAVLAERPAQARAALQKVLAMDISPDARKSAQNALKKIQ
jgi:HEAT repeat protein